VKAYLCLSGFKVAGWFPETVDITCPVATGCGQGAAAQGLFYIIHVIADSVASWDGFCGAAPITRIM